MKPLPVSKSRREDIEAILDISPKVIKDIATKMNAVPITIGSSGLLDIFRKYLEDDIARTLLSHSASLCLLADDQKETVSNVLLALKAGLQNTEKSAEVVKKFDSALETLEELIGSEVLYLSVKATNLFAADTNHLHEFKIYTDARPVFDRGRENVKATLIFSTLSLVVSNANENENSLSVAIRYSDLTKLLEECESAIEKIKNFEDSLQNSQVGDILIYGKTDEL